jgi:hypothetical protein
MSRLSAQALEDRILAALREHYPVPISTGDLVDELHPGKGRYSDEGMAVYRRLYAMVRRDAPPVARSSWPGMRITYWRLAEPPEELEGSWSMWADQLKS